MMFQFLIGPPCAPPVIAMALSDWCLVVVLAILVVLAIFSATKSGPGTRARKAAIAAAVVLACAAATMILLGTSTCIS